MPNGELDSRWQKVLADFGEFALDCEDLDEILTEACRLVASALGTARAKVLEIVDDGATLFVRAGVGWSPGVVGQVRMPMSEPTFETYSIKACQPVVTQDIRRDERFTVPEFMRQAGVIALVNVPIFLPGRQAYGLLQIDDIRPRNFGKDEIQFLRTYAIILGSVVDRLFKINSLQGSEELFQAFAENSTDVIWITSADGSRLEYLSPAFPRIFGAPREPVQADIRRWRDLVHPNDLEGAAEFLPRAIAGETAIAHYRVIRPADGRVVHLRDTGFPIRDGAGAVRRVAGIVQDVTDIHDATAALAAEKERFQTLAEGIPQLVWRSGDTGRWTWASRQWLDFTGQSQEESYGLGWLGAVHHEDRARTEAAWHDARSHGRLDVEHRVRRASDGVWLWHRTIALPLRGESTLAQPEGRLIEWLGTTTDIEDLKRLQEQQEVLVAELQHRTRNLLSVVRNLARKSIPPHHERDEYDARLAALGRVQGFLAGNGHYTVRLRDLVEAELQAVGAELSDRVQVEGPPVDLSGSGAQPVAMALHELATNAVKYGAVAQPGGRLSVTWVVMGEGDDRQLRIAWHESGVAMPPGPPARRGYGSELITRALPYQMGAETALDFTLDGVSCAIVLPAHAFTVV